MTALLAMSPKKRVSRTNAGDLAWPWGTMTMTAGRISTSQTTASTAYLTTTTTVLSATSPRRPVWHGGDRQADLLGVIMTTTGGSICSFQVTCSLILNIPR